MNFKFISAAMAPPFLLGVICLLALAGCGSSSGPTVTGPVNNTVAITASFGPNGQAGGFVNGLYTTVTVCQHGTPNCTTINNVLVDTGSIGLRLAQGTLGSVNLTPISQGGSPLEECIQYGDTSYSWGEMELADIHIAGETALDIPVQLLGDTNATVPQSCLTTPVVAGTPGSPPGNEDTPTTLGANGILGIANGGAAGPWDCGTFCTTTATNLYYTCPNGTCGEVVVPVNDQAINPVAAFASSDNNGMVIRLPSVGSTGAVTVSGTMNFGIGTQSDNALPTVTVYAMDECGDFPTVTFNNVSYTDTSCNQTGSGLGGFVDTGSNALYVSDANTLFSEGLGISDCANNGFYCVTGGGTATLSNIALFGSGVGSGTVLLNITDANTLFSSNNAVFNNLGGPSLGGGTPSTDSFDFGLPFFLGKTVFIGIVGVSGATGPEAFIAPNGFVAF